MFSRTAFSIIVTSNNDPLDSLLLVCTCSVWNTCPFTSQLILHLVRFIIFFVDCSEKFRREESEKSEESEDPRVRRLETQKIRGPEDSRVRRSEAQKIRVSVFEEMKSEDPYPMNILLEMLSKCPRYLSQGPAQLM